MPAPPNIHLTPAQLAKQAERKAAKLARKAASANNNSAEAAAERERRRILRREWAPVTSSGRANGSGAGGSGSSSASGKQRARIVTWNMLAQTLVRRDLFPGSDCLRWGDRKPMLQAEMASHADADVICLQECDRLDDMLSSVPDHEPITTRGPGKLHGLVVLFRRARFAARATEALALDDQELTPEAGTPGARRGVSRQTRNMGLIVALEDKEKEGTGLVIVTTHLFWHPKFMYERTRQVIVLLRAVRKLQAEQAMASWPVVFAGDLNTEPDESTYQMLVAPNAPLHPHLIATFNASRLVHDNVVNVGQTAASEPGSQTASGSATPAAAPKEDKEDEGELPDTDERSIANTRAATEADGIRTLDEMMALGRGLMMGSGARSAYGDSSWAGKTQSFAERGGFPDGVDGAAAGGGEPAYTCFTPKFHLTLDYLFLIPSAGETRAEFTSVLAPPPTEALGAGLPRKGVSASDHLPIGCDIAW